MATVDRRLLLTWFDSEAAARTAADELKAWDKAEGGGRSGAVGILVLDDTGHVKRNLLGPPTSKTGAGIGAILGVIAPPAGGEMVGALYYENLGISQEDRLRIGKEIQGGKAVLGVLAEADAVPALVDKLTELGGTLDHPAIALDDGVTSTVNVARHEQRSTKAKRSPMARQSDKHSRAVLPIPDVPKPGLTTYDAKDPETKYPPIEPLRPPEGAPNVLIVLLDDAGFRRSERVWRTV